MTEPSESNAQSLGIGAPVPRIEDATILRGKARYLDDIDVPALSVAFLRSPHAHARIRSVDTSVAERLPGVRLVVAAADLDGAIDLTPTIDRPGAVLLARPLLCGDKVRFVGEAVAAVVADDRYVAEDALDHIFVDYEPLPAITSIDEATAHEAAQLHDGVGNVIFQERAERGDVDEAFERAAVVIERTFESPRYAAMPLEGRGVLGVPEDGGLVLWSSTQIPHLVAQCVAEALQLDDGRIHVRCPDIGGGFGQKANVYPEEVVVAWAALRLGEPVKWVEDRSENLMSATQAREQRVRVRVAADADGRLLAVDAQVFSDVGAYGGHPWGQLLEALGTAWMIPGPYDLRRYRYATHAVVTNKSPEGPYRGVGLPVSVITHERTMDILARELSMDRAEIRRRNLVRPEQMPYDTATGLQYDSGHYAAALDGAVEALGIDDFAARQRAARASGRALGLGFACYVEWTGTNSETYRNRGMNRPSGYDAARLAVNADGSVSLWTSCPAIGQGVATTFSQIAAEHLGVPIDLIRIETLDTAEAPHGSGTFASRSAISAGGALASVARQLRRLLEEAAADLLEASPADVELVDGRLAVRGSPRRSLSVADVAQATADRLDVAEAYDPPVTAYPYATHACIVEVDRASGEIRIERYVVVEDCGPMINPHIVEGQIHGATAQGIGGALYEALRFGPDGQLLTTSLLDYLIPTGAELPPFELHHLETPAPSLRGGFKGVGEGGILAPPAALANAVSDALGVEINEFPISLEVTRAAAAAIAGRPPDRWV